MALRRDHPISSTCPGIIDELEPGAFAITQVTSTSFHVIPNDGTEEFTCTLSGAAFSCPERASRVEDYRPGLDAVLTLHATADGEFSSSTRGAGRQDANVTCASTQCSTFGVGLPCAFAVDFVIRAY